MSAPEDVREMVRRRYAELATRSAAGDHEEAQAVESSRETLYTAVTLAEKHVRAPNECPARLGTVSGAGRTPDLAAYLAD